MRAACEAAVRRVEFGSEEALWIPEPPLPPRKHARPPHHVPEPEPGSWSWDRLAGLDERGRAVLVRRSRGNDDEAPAAVLAFPSEETVGEDGSRSGLGHLLVRYDGSRTETLRFSTFDELSELTWIDHDDAGRPVSFTIARDDGVREIACVWDGDRCVEQRERDVVLTAEYDAQGLVSVRRGDRAEWDRALDGFEPDPPSADEALETWAASVAAAAERATADVTGAAVLKVIAGTRESEPPRLFVVDTAYLERAEQRVGREVAIWRHWDDGRDLLDEIDAAGLRARRALLQDDDLYAPHFDVILQRQLDARRWPEGAEALAHGRPADPDLPPVPTVDAPPADEAELAALIARFDLPATLIEHARWGLALVAGEGRSRLGGRPELSEPWPLVEGRALTHLASLDLAELPEIPGRADFPADGTLVFLAALSEEDELWEPTRCDDPRVYLRHIPAGTATTAVEPPPESVDEYEHPALLPERRVRFEPVITLPDHPPEGLARDEALGYEQLYEAVAAVTPGLWKSPHLLLGHPSAAQREFRPADEINLVHIGWDMDLDFQFLDGGTLTVHGLPEDVRAGRWDRLTVTPSSS